MDSIAIITEGTLYNTALLAASANGHQVGFRILQYIQYHLLQVKPKGPSSTSNGKYVTTLHAASTHNHQQMTERRKGCKKHLIMSSS